MKTKIVYPTLLIIAIACFVLNIISFNAEIYMITGFLTGSLLMMVLYDAEIITGKVHDKGEK